MGEQIWQLEEEFLGVQNAGATVQQAAKFILIHLIGIGHNICTRISRLLIKYSTMLNINFIQRIQRFSNRHL